MAIVHISCMALIWKQEGEDKCGKSRNRQLNLEVARSRICFLSATLSVVLLCLLPITAFRKHTFITWSSLTFGLREPIYSLPECSINEVITFRQGQKACCVFQRHCWAKLFDSGLKQKKEVALERTPGRGAAPAASAPVTARSPQPPLPAQPQGSARNPAVKLEELQLIAPSS